MNKMWFVIQALVCLAVGTLSLLMGEGLVFLMGLFFAIFSLCGLFSFKEKRIMANN